MLHVASSSVFLRPEEEERSKHPEDQVREESECRETLRPADANVVLKQVGCIMVDDCTERGFVTVTLSHSLHPLSAAGPMGGFHRRCRGGMTRSSRTDL